MKAIETVFEGHRFRSRLEARWAVFFSTIGVPYEYEKEGYELGDGVRYLPDFWLPDQKCWVEVKGEIPNELECQKAELLVLQKSKEMQKVRLFITSDIPPAPIDGITQHSLIPTRRFQYSKVDDKVLTFEPFYWARCPHCRKFDISYFGYMSRLMCKCTETLLFKLYDEAEVIGKGQADEAWWVSKFHEIDYVGNHPQIEGAYDAARQARFEHGQSGAPHEWKGGQS